jgi:hypothetical protein
MLWTGLRPELKDVSGHKYDQCTTFAELMVSLRRIERDLAGRDNDQKKKSATPVMAAIATENKEIQELKGMIRKLSVDVAELKKGKGTTTPDRNSAPGSYSATRPRFPPRPPPRYGNDRPQDNYPQPRVGGNYSSRQGRQPRYGWTTDHQGNPTPICFLCGQSGHFRYQCSYPPSRDSNPLN